jgi:hypothetical protein
MFISQSIELSRANSGPVLHFTRYLLRQLNHHLDFHAFYRVGEFSGLIATVVLHGTWLQPALFAFLHYEDTQIY